MTDFKAGDKVVVREDIAADRPWWTVGKVYTVNENGCVRDDCGVASLAEAYLFAPAPDADGWYPMPKLKAGDPIPEWLVDPKTRYRHRAGGWFSSDEVTFYQITAGIYTHYRPAPQTVTATTADGKEYLITHNPDGSVSAEVV